MSKKKNLSQHQSSWEACSKTTLFNASHAAYNFPDQCKNHSLCPCTAVICCHCKCKCYYCCAVCVLLCIRKCWKYRHPYMQLIQIITSGHQRSKRQKGHLTDISHCLFSTLQSGNYLSPVHWSTQNVTFVALFN